MQSWSWECVFSREDCDSRSKVSMPVRSFQMSWIWLTTVTDRRPAATQIHASLLNISVGAVLMPAAYHYSLSWRTDATSTDQKSAILKMSHGVGAFSLRRETVTNVFIKVSVVLVTGAISLDEMKRIPICSSSILCLPPLSIMVTHVSVRRPR